MEAIFVLLVLSIAAVSGLPEAIVQQGRIMGGTLTTIDQYPSMAALLVTRDFVQWKHNCGGSILNQRSIMSAAHCIHNDYPNRWRVRLGSTFANSGGVVLNFASFIVHPNWDPKTVDNDIAIMRTVTGISYTDVIQPARIGGAFYDLRDNQHVWAAGWGNISPVGPSSEQLRHVEIFSINQVTCRRLYSGRAIITDNMLCSGVLGVGGRDQCKMDSGGPLYHNGVVVGVCSFGVGCGDPHFPGVNARVSRYTAWIQTNS